MRRCVLAALGLGAAFASCDRSNSDAFRTEIPWTAVSETVSIAVLAKGPDAFGRTRTLMRIKSANATLETNIDDDMSVGQFSVFRRVDWAFVVNDVYVVAAVNTKTLEMIGENDWDKLPFTVWNGRDTVLARGPRRGDVLLPAQFPLRREEGTE